MLFKKTKIDVEKKNLRKLSKYISSTLKKGFSESEIKKSLSNENWPKEMIDKELSKINNKQTPKKLFTFDPFSKLETILKKIKKPKKNKEENKMAKKLTAEQANSFLRQLDTEKSFWVNNGAVLTNLEEFSKELKSIEPEQFSHHVTREKNDFANWISEVIGDQTLARTLSRAKTPRTVAQTVDKRLNYLKKIVK
jgi:chromosome condensin MukBEF ATPase and DNA-binding subunit MukB